MHAKSAKRKALFVSLITVKVALGTTNLTSGNHSGSGSVVNSSRGVNSQANEKNDYVPCDGSEKKTFSRHSVTLGMVVKVGNTFKLQTNQKSGSGICEPLLSDEDGKFLGVVVPFNKNFLSCRLKDKLFVSTVPGAMISGYPGIKKNLRYHLVALGKLRFWVATPCGMQHENPVLTYYSPEGIRKFASYHQTVGSWEKSDIDETIAFVKSKVRTLSADESVQKAAATECLRDMESVVNEQKHGEGGTAPVIENKSNGHPSSMGELAARRTRKSKMSEDYVEE